MGETVSLRPTKELFIDVLTRDISVHDCILDLLDNAVDSYTKNGIAERREIRLDYGQDGLRLVDNCGGIPKVRFMSEVFRLGSIDPTSSGPTIGVYGIGLKRSVFKLGRLIVVETDDGRDYCRLKIDVDQWLSEPDNWEVPLTESSPSRLGGGGLPYTSIEVSKLTRAAKETFTPEFERRLKETVKIYYSLFIQDGQIGFFLNDEEQTGFELTVKAGADYMPVRVADKYDGAEIDIICFIDFASEQGRAERKRGRQGWNVFMNRRLVIADDTSPATGWRGEPGFLPKHHPIYHQFVGIVFVTCNDPSKLPINTAKNGFDEGSPMYHHLVNKMCEVARPLINHLSAKYDREKEGMDGEEGKVVDAIDRADEEVRTRGLRVSSIQDAEYVSTFAAPERRSALVPREPYTSIQYRKPKRYVDLAKKVLHLRSNSAVGEKTFDIFMESEGLIDDKESDA